MAHPSDQPGIQVRMLGPTSIEDYHAHLMRLDRTSRFPATDDAAIDKHCLDLLGAGAILIGIYVDGVMRAGAEIVPDRTASRALAALTVEPGHDIADFERDLTMQVIEAARRYHLREIQLLAQSEARMLRLPAVGIAA